MENGVESGKRKRVDGLLDAIYSPGIDWILFISGKQRVRSF